MKRIVVFALILNAALLGVIAQQFIALAGDDGPLATRQNGDVNGDQILDMSDAVYLLIHLFNGGPNPVALADSPEVLDRLDILENAVTGLLADDWTPSLQGVLFHRASLELMDLRGAQLQGVQFDSSNMRGANLSGANLRDADISGTDMSNTILRNVDLTGANLQNTDLQDADLRGATGANFFRSVGTPAFMPEDLLDE